MRGVVAAWVPFLLILAGLTIPSHAHAADEALIGPHGAPWRGSPAMPGSWWADVARLVRMPTDVAGTAAWEPPVVPASSAASDCRPHPPIRIEEDRGPRGFILGDHPLHGGPLYRPGSGVVAGTGTAGDPYVIAGWCIGVDQTAFLVDGIAIRGTDAHVVIQNNHLVGLRVGVDVQGSHGVQIVGNQMQRMSAGVRGADAPGLVVAGNVFADAGTALSLTRSDDVRLADNDIVGGAVGMYVAGNASIVRDNRFAAQSAFAIDLDGGAEHEIRNNSLRPATGFAVTTGLLVRETNRTVVADNTFEEMPLAMAFIGANDPRIERNRMTDGWNDIILGSSSGIVLRENVMERGIAIIGTERGHYDHTIDTTNTVGGQPVLYLRSPAALFPGQWGQVILFEASDLIVTDHGDHGALFPTLVAFSTNVTIRDHDLAPPARIDLHHSRSSTIVNNTVDSVLVEGGEANEVQHNQMAGGITLFGSDAVEVHHNAFVGDGLAAVVVFGGDDVRIRSNDFSAALHLGVWSLSVEADARGNWWGCPEGPKHPGCAGVGGTVRYDPWRTTPVPDAGRYP